MKKEFLKIYLLFLLFIVATASPLWCQQDDTIDTLKVFPNGYILHKMWTVNGQNDVVKVVMTQSGEGIYRGYLHLRSKILDDGISDVICLGQHIYGTFDNDGNISDVYVASKKEWHSPVKTWKRKLSGTLLKFTFSQGGTGYVNIVKKFVFNVPVAGSDQYNYHTQSRDRHLRGGYESTITGNARVTFKWTLKDDVLNITYNPLNTVSYNVSAAMTSTFEDCSDWGNYRKNIIAQSKRDIVTNPDVARQKQVLKESLVDFVEYNCKNADRFKVCFITDGVMGLSHILNGEYDINKIIRFEAEGDSRMYFPDFNRIIEWEHNLKLYETPEQKAKRLAEEKRIEEEKLRLKNEQDLRSVKIALYRTLSKIQDYTAPMRTNKVDFNKLDDSFYQRFDYQGILNPYEMNTARMRTAVKESLMPICPLLSFYIDTVFKTKEPNEYRAVFLVNKKISDETNECRSFSFVVDMNNTRLVLKSVDMDKARVIYNIWDRIHGLQDSITTLKQTIIGEYGNVFSDICKSYSKYEKQANMTISNNPQETVQRLLDVIKNQNDYIRFAQLRSIASEKKNRILMLSLEDYNDVGKDYNTYLKEYNVVMSLNTNESIQRIVNLINVSDSCLKYLDFRKEISDNSKIIIQKAQTSKKLVGEYVKYMKTIDLSWSPSKTSGYLQQIVWIQNKVLDLLNNSNINVINQKLKKIKTNSFPSLLKSLEDEFGLQN